MAKETKDIREGDNYLMHGRLSERKMLALGDVSGRGEEVVVEVNWNSLVKKKGYIKISIGDKEAVVDRDQLWSILFMLGSAEEQEALVDPFLKKTRVTKFFKMIGITTTRDIRKGEMINVPLEFTLNPSDNSVIIGKGNINVLRKSLMRDRSGLA